MLTGFLLVLPWAASGGVPESLDSTSIAWLAAAGLGNVFGLLLSYGAMRVGKLGVVAPIVSTEGAIAALIAVLAGEELAGGVGAMLVVIAVGIVLAATTGRAESAVPPEPARVPLLALAASLSFGVSIYATGRASAELPIAWAIMPPRVVGVLVVLLPLVLSSSLRWTRRALVLAVCSGLAEVVGFALYAMGSRSGIAVSAVLASQFAAIAAVAAYFLFHERLTRLQRIGAAIIVAGVATLTALQV
jgi:drug/metabolite transporter (DMT)-like permease